MQAPWPEQGGVVAHPGDGWLCVKHHGVSGVSAAAVGDQQQLRCSHCVSLMPDCGTC